MIRWLREAELRAMHLELVAEHGGLPGVRSPEMLDSALARPKNLAAYANPTLAELAAAYGFGIAKNHPFLDGNKRVVLTGVGVFLDLNGWDLTASQEDAVLSILALAAGDLTEAQLAKWICDNVEQKQKVRITPASAG